MAQRALHRPSALIGLGSGIVVGAIAVAGFLGLRAIWLSEIEFELTRPPVPGAVVRQIRAAEVAFREARPAWRRGVERVEDIVVFAVPEVAYAANLSVGPYQIKARTIEELLPWAIDNGFIRIAAAPPRRALAAIAYFSEQPGLSEWQAAALIAFLRQSHPGLAELDWATIAADPSLVAKLYSGYMGAGGDWDAWRADLRPGPVARDRLGLADD